METNHFLVKEESLTAFVRKHIVPNPIHEFTGSPNLGDTMYFLNSIHEEIKGDMIKFEMQDSCKRSGRNLNTAYLYALSYHDDVSVKLTLMDFEVKVVS